MIHFYEPYFIFHEVELPELNQGDVLKNIVVISKEKSIQPPLRFNQASLLEQMEKEQIGTKATRAEIIGTLFKRNYIIASQNLVGIEVRSWICRNRNNEKICSKYCFYRFYQSYGK